MEGEEGEKEEVEVEVEVEEEVKEEVSNFLYLLCCYNIVVIIITLFTKSLAFKELNYAKFKIMPKT